MGVLDIELGVYLPDAVLEAIDEFGDSLLVGTPGRMSGKSRTDLRIEISVDSESTAICRYKTVHTQSPPVLRDRGSFMTTIIDGIDEQLQEWSIEPPGAYTATVDDTHHYEGTLQLLRPVDRTLQLPRLADHAVMVAWSIFL